jgi:hypothetical protein
MTAVSAVPASADVISLPDERESIRRRLLQRSAREVAEQAFARADDYDEDGAYPPRTWLRYTSPASSRPSCP